MQRLVAHEARIIHLAWLPTKEAYEFRLLYGRRFITPKLQLTPLDWYDLLAGRMIKLGDWVTLVRQGAFLRLTAAKELVYEGGNQSAVPTAWPLVRFADFYDAAARERGSMPETGWECAYEADIERRRNEWRPA